MESQATTEELQGVVEAFWDVVPPFWHFVKAHIRRTATDRHHISVEQFHALRHIRRGTGSVSGLSDILNISRPAISQTVESLVEKGLVSRKTDEQDRRFIQLQLTDTGNALLDDVFGETRAWMGELFKSLEPGDVAEITRGIQTLGKITLS